MSEKKRCCDLCIDTVNNTALPVRTINAGGLFFCACCGFVDEEDTVRLVIEDEDETN